MDSQINFSDRKPYSVVDHAVSVYITVNDNTLEYCNYQNTSSLKDGVLVNITVNDNALEYCNYQNTSSLKESWQQIENIERE